MTIDGADDDRNTGISHGWMVLVKAIVRIARKKSNAYIVKSMAPVLILYQTSHSTIAEESCSRTHNNLGSFST